MRNYHAIIEYIPGTHIQTELFCYLWIFITNSKCRIIVQRLDWLGWGGSVEWMLSAM